MGNTISVSPNILFFQDPVTKSRIRLLHHIVTHPPLLDKLPTLPRPIPSLHSSSAPEKPTLKCYTITPSPNGISGTLLGILWSLCNSLLSNPNPNHPQQQNHQYIWNRGYKPRALFHLRGNFENPSCNALLSVLLEKVDRYVAKDGGIVVTGSHTFVHIYEPAWLAQGFGKVLRELEGMGAVKDVRVGVDRAGLNVLEAYALFWAKSWWEGVGSGVESGMEGERVMKRLEDRLWEIWFGHEGTESFLEDLIG